jgi:hypothetical protein
MDKTILAAVFDDYHRALATLDGLINAGVDASLISIVMSDREAERHFTPAARMKLGPLPVTEAALPIARDLAPLAALGTAGTGVVASGPAVSNLVAAGVGAGGGLRRGLVGLGLSRETADQVAGKIRNGGLLVAVTVTGEGVQEQSTPVLAHGSSMQLELHATRDVEAKPTLRSPEVAAEPRDTLGSVVEASNDDEPVRRAS